MRKINIIMLALLKLFPKYEFEKLEKKYHGNYYTKYFPGPHSENGKVPSNFIIFTIIVDPYRLLCP